MACFCHFPKIKQSLWQKKEQCVLSTGMKQTDIKQAKKMPRTNKTDNNPKKIQISEQSQEKNTKYFLFKKLFYAFSGVSTYFISL